MMNCAGTRGHASGGAPWRRSYHGLVMPGTSFGPNEWLVEEMYDRFRADPESVGPSWREFFANYRQASAPPRSAAAHPPDVPVPATATAPPPTVPAPSAAPPSTDGDGDQPQPLKGAAARIVANMEASLTVPTATSVRRV